MLFSLLSLLIGIIGGTCGGLFGLAGGIIVIPLSIWLLSMPQLTAQGTSLFAILFPISILGVLNYHREGHIDIPKGFLIAAGLFLGSHLGSRLAVSLHDESMRKIFAIFVVSMGVFLFLKK